MGRVTLVVNNLDEGSETFLHSLAVGLAEEGHQVTVHALLEGRAAMSSAGALSDQDRIVASRALPAVRSPRFAGAATRLLGGHPGATATALRRARARFGSGARAARAAAVAAPLLATEPDVVHVAFSGIGVAVLDALELLDPGCRLVVSCRGSGELVAPVIDPPIRRPLERLFARADAVHAVADVVAAAACSLGAREQVVHVIRPAIDVEVFSRTVPRQRSEVLEVVTVARLHWIKALDVQLTAAAGLRDRGVALRWTIVGDGPERGPLEFRARALGLEGVVEFAGGRGRAEVRDLLEGADVFVLSSLSEGTANSVLEAMALELAVVSTDAGGMGEVLTDGVDAVVLPVGDPGSLVSAIERLAEQPALAAELGAAARRTVHGGYTLERQRRQWGDLYEQLLRTSPESSR